MALGLLSSILKVPIKAQIGFLKLDASISENHNRSAQVTDNEIEDGSEVSDHVKLDPESLTMEGMVSDAPVSVLGLGVSEGDILGAAKDFINGDKSAFSNLADSFTSQFKSKSSASTEDLVKRANRTPKEAWKYLNELWKNRQPFSIVTSLDRYENMIITNLSAPRTAKNGNSLMFTATLRKISIVKSSVVTIAAFKTESGATENSASSKSKTGKQSTKEASEKQADNSSLLLKGFKKVGIFN